MKSKIKFILFVVFILLIFLKTYIFSTKYIDDNYSKEYTVFIESLKSKSDTKVAYNVKLLNSNYPKDKFILNIYDSSYDDVETNLEIYSNYKYGDVLKIKGKIQVPKKLNNPGEFDYKLYLYSNNVYGLINTYEIPEKTQYTLNVIENIYSKIYMFKDYVQNIIKSSMNEINANTAMSMIYGDATNLDETIKENFEAVGVSHLMSVSGTHITYFMIIINLFLGRKKKTSISKKEKSENIFKINNKIKAIIQITCIGVYIIFTGTSISVIRAGIMLIIYIIYDLLDKKRNKYKAITITFFIILFENPYCIFNTGMKLSFLATIGIILFSKYFVKFFETITVRIKNELIKKIVQYITQSIAITIAVQILIIPIQINSFNKLPFPVIIPNLVIGMIAIPILVMGMLGIMLSFIPVLSCKIFSVVEIFVGVLINTIKIFNGISFSITTVSIPLVIYVFYYIFVISLFVYLKIKSVVKNKVDNNEKNKLEMYNLKRLLKFLKVFCITLGIILGITIIYINIYSIYFSKYVYFFNVEQGDMSYIKCENRSVIVDIGSMNNTLSFNTISNFFKVNNLNKVDAIVISHMHKDHINGLEKFVQNYTVGQVIYSKPKEESEAFKEFLKLLEKYNLNSKEVKYSDTIDIGKIRIQVLLPDDKYIDCTDDINANSLVCMISVNNKQLLYMGDASFETEEKLIEKYITNENISDINIKLKDIYVLKVGHHGSKTATSEEFIQKLQPQNAVISSLKKYYGHPHENTIQTLKQNNVYTYLTEINGAIKFSLN